MKKLILVILSVAPLFVFGQTNVKSYENTNVVVGAKRPENSSVILEAESTTKGFLPPRMTSTQRNAMTPVGGLTIYNSTDSVMQHYDGSKWVSEARDTFVMIVACSDETTNLVAGSSTNVVTFRTPYAIRVTGVKADVNTAPTGSNITVDVNESGVSILSTLITIEATEKTSLDATTQPVISDQFLANNSEITVNIDTVGSTAPGKGLKLTIYYLKQ